MTTTIEWKAAHRFLLVAPMFHIGGLAPLVANVLRGSATILLPDFDPVKVWDTIRDERITTMMTVPLMLGALLQLARTGEVDMGSLISLTCGGATVPRHLIDGFAALGVPVQVVYGITEFSGGVTFWAPAMGADKVDSQGRSIFGARVAVISTDTGELARTGEPGELLVHGPQRFDRYWQDQDATAEAITDDGWYRTGDVAYIDAEGFVHLVDRVKDVIISGGENIYPAEIESAIAGHADVVDVAVVGRSDDTWGETPVACVVLKPDSDTSETEIIEYCRNNLASYKAPGTVVFTAVIPRNTLGKVLRRELRASPVLQDAG